MISHILRDVSFIRNLPVKQFNYYQIITSKNEIETYDILNKIKKTKNFRPCDLNLMSESPKIWLYLYAYKLSFKQCYVTVILTI